MIKRAPQEILSTLCAARTVAEELKGRLQKQRDAMDLGDLAHIQTTVKKIEELLTAASEYEDELRVRMRQIAVRIDHVGDGDEGPLTSQQLAEIRSDAARHLPAGKALREASLFPEAERGLDAQD